MCKHVGSILIKPGQPTRGLVRRSTEQLDNTVVPIEQTGKKREADSRYSIDTPRLDPPLDVMSELLSED